MQTNIGRRLLTKIAGATNNTSEGLNIRVVDIAALAISRIVDHTEFYSATDILRGS